MTSKQQEILFPSRVAGGKNFCNRVQEKKRLVYNINNIQHTLLISPRRYGKTSLVTEAIHETGLPFGYIHFFNAYRDDIILKRFADGLGRLLTQLLPRTKMAKHKFAGLLRHAKVSLQFTAVRAQITIVGLRS